MQELRKDPIIGRWVIMATSRARRPGNFINPNESDLIDPKKEQCLFCQGQEHLTGPEIFSIRDKASKPDATGWKVRVVPDQKPILKAFIDFKRSTHGLYSVLDGKGADEIVVETPEHVANMADLQADQIASVIKAYTHRINDLEKDERLKYVLAHKNYKWSRDQENITHAHSEIIATPVTPMRIKEELKGAKKYFDYHDRCIFCDLIKQEKEMNQRIVLEDEHFLAMVPFASRFPFETWILPKRHHCSFPRGIQGLELDLAKILKQVLLKIKIGLGDPAYHYVIHSAPFLDKERRSASDCTLEEDYHWHIEVMPRLTHAAGFEKGTGFYICPIPPEAAAQYLKEVEISS